MSRHDCPAYGPCAARVSGARRVSVTCRMTCCRSGSARPQVNDSCAGRLMSLGGAPNGNVLGKQRTNVHAINRLTSRRLQGIQGEWGARRELQIREQEICRHRHVNLAHHGVGAGAEKRLDAQMLLDPFEEQLDLPARPIDLRNRFRAQRKKVREEEVAMARSASTYLDASQSLGIRSALRPVSDRLINVPRQVRGSRHAATRKPRPA